MKELEKGKSTNEMKKKANAFEMKKKANAFELRWIVFDLSAKSDISEG